MAEKFYRIDEQGLIVATSYDPEVTVLRSLRNTGKTATLPKKEQKKTAR